MLSAIYENQPQSDIFTGCPDDDEVGGHLYPIADDACTSDYWICLYGKPYRTVCAADLIFDPKLKVCQFKENIVC